MKSKKERKEDKEKDATARFVALSLSRFSFGVIPWLRRGETFRPADA